MKKSSLTIDKLHMVATSGNGQCGYATTERHIPVLCIVDVIPRLVLSRLTTNFGLTNEEDGCKSRSANVISFQFP
jgi:hypothetical protein